MKILRNEDGQALIITLMCLTILLGFVGFATDVGTLFYTKRELQIAADSAALAAASESNLNNGTLLQTAATNDAATNGVVAGPNTTIVVNNPYTPAVCTGTCNPNNYVEVKISQKQNSLFMSLFTGNPVTVAARAVGLLKSNPGCFFTLDNGSVAGSFNFFGVIFTLQAPQCAMWVDSSNVNALTATGALYGINARSIGVVGNYNHGGFLGGIHCTVGGPCPSTGIVPVNDPLAYLTPPATAACLPSHTNLGLSTGPVAYQNPWTAANIHLSPGNYCGTTTPDGAHHPAINLTNQAGITLAPGTYMINGGLSAGNGAAPAGGGIYAAGIGSGNFGADISGSNVTLYLYNGASLYINTNFSIGNFKLTAPLPGSQYAGILVYQDRADVTPATVGGFFSIMDIEGAMYLPSATLTFQQFIGALITHSGIYVAKDISIGGVLGTMTDYANAPGVGGNSPIKSVVLAE